jgi:hypothetical protein
MILQILLEIYRQCLTQRDHKKSKIHLHLNVVFESLQLPVLYHWYKFFQENNTRQKSGNSSITTCEVQ